MEDILVTESLASFGKVKLENVLELHFQQLSEVLAADFILLVYQQENQGGKKIMFYREFNEFTISHQEVKLLISDLYIQPPFAFLEANYLGDYHHHYLYICPLEKRSLGLEYLLFLSHNQPLSESLQKNIKKQLEILKEYLALYQAYLKQNEEIHNLEHLIHKIGHELRNPLSLIGLIAENLRLSLSTQELDEQIFSIQHTITKLNQNLTELIDCSKRGKLKLELQDLRQLFAQTVNYLQRMIESKEISLQYPQNQEVILAVDGLQIQQVFGNLLSNAIYFSPQGGKIICNWQLFQEEVVVTLADQGQGLSKEDLKNLFTPFYSRRPQGTGLGLTIVKKIIMDHGGSIWASNLPQGGTQFTFTLPC
jgi:signal transduction histidine kinase